jgi:transposase
LIGRLQKYKESVLAFLFDPAIPFTNNEAERPLRPIKGKQKISGCFRTSQGADNFAIVQSCISSFSKQGKNIMEETRKALRAVYPIHDLLPHYTLKA